MSQNLEPDKQSQQRLLPRIHNPKSKSLLIAHIFAWMCIILDLMIVPIMSFLLMLVNWLLFTTEPCGCYGYVKEQDTHTGNIGVCSCFISKWSESQEKDYSGNYGCWSEIKHESYPQFCPGGDSPFLLAMCILNMIMYGQYHVCFLCLCITGLCSVTILVWAFTYFFLFIGCIIISFIYCLWCIPNVNAEQTPLEYFQYIFNKYGSELYEYLNENCQFTYGIKAFTNLVWNPFAPTPNPTFCGAKQINIVIVWRVLNFVGSCIMIGYLIAVPMNQYGLNKFNCSKYGLDSKGNAYELKVDNLWHLWLHNNFLLALWIVYIIFIMFLFFSRRLTLRLLRANVEDLDSNKEEQLYARMVGYKKRMDGNAVVNE